MAGLNRRWALIGAAVLVVGAGVGGAVLLTGDSDSTDPAVQSAPGITAADVTEAQGDEAKGHNDGSQRADQKGGPQLVPKPPKPPKPAPACPQGVSRAECRAAARALERLVGGSSTVKKGECPSALSPEECRQAAAALKQLSASGGSHTVQKGECPHGLSHEECRQAAEALKQLSASGGSSEVSECPSALSRAECRAAAEAVK